MNRGAVVCWNLYLRLSQPRGDPQKSSLLEMNQYYWMIWRYPDILRKHHFLWYLVVVHYVHRWLVIIMLHLPVHMKVKQSFKHCLPLHAMVHTCLNR